MATDSSTAEAQTPQQRVLKSLSDALTQDDDTAIAVALRAPSLLALVQSVPTATVPLEDLVFVGALLELLGATLAEWNRVSCVLIVKIAFFLLTYLYFFFFLFR